MDITRLKSLRELSARQTIASVAEALNLTPSAVSQHISQLEDEVGVALTKRNGRGVKLTHAGEVLATHAERVMTVLDEAKSEMAVLRNEIAGTIRIAAFATAAATLLPPVLKTLQRKYPRLEIRLVEMEPSEGLAALGSWDTDLAIVDDLSVRLARMGRTVQKVRLIDDELLVVMSEDHPLTAKASLTLPELKDEVWALDSATSFYGEFVLDLCRKSGFSPKVNASCRGAEIIAAMVEAGCSISIIPGLRLRQLTQHLVARPLRPSVIRRISLAFRVGERSHPSVKVFLHELHALWAA